MQTNIDTHRTVDNGEPDSARKKLPVFLYFNVVRSVCMWHFRVIHVDLIFRCMNKSNRRWSAIAMFHGNQ